VRAMDNEIKDILVKLLEGQNRLEHEVSGIKIGVKKNSIELETIAKTVNRIIKVQTDHKERNDFLFKNTNEIVDEKMDSIEDAVTNVSKELKDIKEATNMIFVEKVSNEIRRFYKLNGYDFVKPVRVKDLVLYTKLYENQILKIVKELAIKGYLVEICLIDKNGCEFSLTDLGKEKLLYI
jgi:hypothetical protein